jgi:ankyrin repeat protein
MRSKTNLVFPVLMLGLCAFCYCEVPQKKCGTLLESVQNNDLKQVLMLLDQGVDINCRGAYNYTPLIVAAKYGWLEIAQALCERGADLNASADSNEMQRERGFTPLLWAAWNCDLYMAELLISKGAAVGQKGRGRDIPLIIAARKDCLRLAKMFIEKGAAVDAVDEDNGDTALIRAVSGGHLDLVEYLIEKGADTGRRDQAGRDLLSIAAGSGHLAKVRYLHEKGFSVNATDKLGRTAIFDAVSDGVESRYILEYLIEHGANVSARSAGGTTPLMVASFDGASTAAGILIANGAAVNDINNYKETPLHEACRGMRGIEDVTKWEATIKLLLDKGAQVNTQDCDGRTPLMEAACSKAPRVVETLLKHGALVNTQDKKGWTALMYAAYWDQTAVIKVLAQQGADLNLRNSKGETALAVAKKRTVTAQAYELLKSLGAKD